MSPATLQGPAVAATADWNGRVNFWSAKPVIDQQQQQQQQAGEEEDKKSKKPSKKRAAAATPPHQQQQPINGSAIALHSSCVTSLCWPLREVIYSASLDHTVKSWDAHTLLQSSGSVGNGKETNVWRTGTAVNSVDFCPLLGGLLATAHTDPIIR